MTALDAICAAKLAFRIARSDEVPGGIFHSNFARTLKCGAFGPIDFRSDDGGFDGVSPLRTSAAIAGKSFSALA